MKTKLIRPCGLLTAFFAPVARARAQTTALTYQGRFNTTNGPVSNGLFTGTLDCGNLFDGGLRRLVVAAKTSFALLLPCLLLACGAVRAKGECRTNVPIIDAMSYGFGNLWGLDQRFPFVAYRVTTYYGLATSLVDRVTSKVLTDECATNAFSRGDW